MIILNFNRKVKELPCDGQYAWGGLYDSLYGLFFQGETLGWRRLMAIGIGFIGMLLTVNPGSDGFNAYSLFGLAAVVCVTIRDLTARSLRSKLSSQEISSSLGWACSKRRPTRQCMNLGYPLLL